MRQQPIKAAFAIFLAIGAGIAGQAAGQCILANPSFEVGGQGGAVFGGWNQFGLIGSVNEATHGSAAARVSGPDIGDWGVSGYWQSQDCEPGEQWEATGHVRHPASAPLTGESVALANVEWRGAGGGLIAYDSFVVADAATPADEYVEFSVLSAPAPEGTAAARFVLMVLQSPGEDPPDVYFDQVTFFSTTPPIMDDLQWDDFPGGRSVEFAGRSWRIKGPGWYDPGPSHYCDLPDCVWVDEEDRLHISIKYHDAAWRSSEVTLEDALGYGDYVFTTIGDLDQLDVHTVLGLFIWQYGPCWDYGYLWWNPFNEIDVEISRWGVPGNDIGQFVAQPWDWGGNMSRFDASFDAGEISSHAFNWLPDRVEFRSWRGGPGDESPENMIHAWTYTGPHIPRPEQPRVHLNLWQFDGPPAVDQEVVFDDFTFLPADAPTGAPDAPATPSAALPAVQLHPAVPNPFNPATTIRYELMEGSLTELAVYDVTGARVRVLVDGFVTAGAHEAVWDGRDDAGALQASGVYLAVLRAGGTIEAQRMVLIK